ncbi:hypothetical protein BGZ73_002131 [Actinomortierella ambigua]|nr:hypothetical protein BGZ73_002131 [Actinomortierella ambigua]
MDLHHTTGKNESTTEHEIPIEHDHGPGDSLPEPYQQQQQYSDTQELKETIAVDVSAEQSTNAPSSSSMTQSESDQTSPSTDETCSLITAPVVVKTICLDKDIENTSGFAYDSSSRIKEKELEAAAGTAEDTWPSGMSEKKCGGDVESRPSFYSDRSDKSNSPIEEVRAIVPVTDDPTLPTNTFRMWFLSIFFTLIVSFVNQFFYLRQNPVAITYTVVSLVSLPIGNLMARTFSTRKFRIFGRECSFNPGPFNIKEHVLIGTAVACSSSTAYAVDIVILQRKYYNEDKGFLAGFLLILTTQITGFSLAGVLRKFLVKPAHMIWPANLVTVALFRTLHENKTGTESNSGHYKGPSRMRYWFPNYIFPTLTALSVLCWIKPDNIVLAQLTGSNGLGIGTLSLDWATSTSALAPLVTPWWAQVNILIGFIIVAWIIAPVAYYANLWNSKSFPILTAELFREDGSPYDKEMVMTNNVLDLDKYKAYGPLKMDSFFALTYGIGFAGLTATLTHVILYHGEEIRRHWRAAMASCSSTSLNEEDVHSKLMRTYKEVPQWWYGALFLISLSLSILTVVQWNYLPWYYLIVSLAIAFIFALPVGVVQAVTNQQPGLNVITEYVIGYLMPGHPIANVTFKAYGYITNVQALQFTQDLKLGHYMKIPPRIMFWVQVISSILAGLINLATTDWLLRVRPNICTKADYPWTCRNTNS